MRRSMVAFTSAVILSACAQDIAAPSSAAAPTLASNSSTNTTAPSAVKGGGGPTVCKPDAKLIGRIALSTADEPGTWWYLTREGLDKAGLTDYKATIEGWFGKTFATLDLAVAYLVDQVRPVDENLNSFVCAYVIRGTRTNIGDPFFTLTAFTTRDDSFGKP